MSAPVETDPRTDRIIEVAIELAEENGYEAVRLRDLAARADVALGTVYRRFSSKEDILAAALERMVEAFHDAVMLAPVPGESALECIIVFFEMATQTLALRPKLAGALLRAVASGDPEIAVRVLSYRDTMSAILLVVLRGLPDGVPPTEAESLVVRQLQNVWFAEMVGWTGGLHDPETAVDHLRDATAVLLRALE